MIDGMNKLWSASAVTASALAIMALTACSASEPENGPTSASVETSAVEESAVVATDRSSDFTGRWTRRADYVPEEEYTAPEDKPYKTVDILPCAEGLCAVSVSEAGTCGEELFHFKPDEAEQLFGEAKWGAKEKGVALMTGRQKDGEPTDRLVLMVGSEPNIYGREGPMPDYDAHYKRAGEAQCSAG